MSELNESRKAAIKFWERWRIAYNLALMPPTFVGYVHGGINVSLGAPELSFAETAGILLLAILGANLCYTIAYVFEFFLLDSRLHQAWLRTGRPAILLLGILFGMILAYFGGMDLVYVQYQGIGF